MTIETKKTIADDAAEAFYGQSDHSFANQVADICRSDERLIAVFNRTRERYAEAKAGGR